MTSWQPIETAPKDGTRVLLTVICEEWFIGRFYPDYDEWGDDDMLFCSPSFWHPLPPHPETP